MMMNHMAHYRSRTLRFLYNVGQATPSHCNTQQQLFTHLHQCTLSHHRCSLMMMNNRVSSFSSTPSVRTTQTNGDSPASSFSASSTSPRTTTTKHYASSAEPSHDRVLELQQKMIKMELGEPGQIEVAKNNLRSILALIIDQQKRNQQSKEQLSKMYRVPLSQVIKKLYDYFVKTKDQGTSMSFNIIIKNKYEESNHMLPIDMIQIENEHLRVISVSIETYKRCVSHFENNLKPLKKFNEETYYILVSKFAEKYRELGIECLNFQRESIPERDKIHSFHVLRSLEHRIELSNMFYSMMVKYFEEFASVYANGGNARIKEAFVMLLSSVYVNISLRGMEQTAIYRPLTIDEKMEFIDSAKQTLSGFCRLVKLEPFEFLDAVIMRLFFYRLIDLTSQGMQYFEKMKNQRKLSLLSYNIMLSEWGSTVSDPQQLFSVLAEMKQVGIEPNASTFVLLIKKFGQNSNLVMVDKLMQMAEERGFSHHYPLLNALLNIYAQRVNIKKMDELIEKLKQTPKGLLAMNPPNTSLVINAYLVSDNLLKADIIGRIFESSLNIEMCRRLLNEATRRDLSSTRSYWDSKITMLLNGISLDSQQQQFKGTRTEQQAISQYKRYADKSLNRFKKYNK